MNILAIGAHPDDIEQNCGGTLAKYAKLGHKVFTATATNGNIGSATEYVDITDVIDIKRAMCYEHKSQIQWMSDNYKDAVGDKDFLEANIIQSRYRGIQCGVDYAEGFRMANDAFRVFPKRILP